MNCGRTHGLITYLLCLAAICVRNIEQRDGVAQTGSMDFSLHTMWMSCNVYVYVGISVIGSYHKFIIISASSGIGIPSSLQQQTPVRSDMPRSASSHLVFICTFHMYRILS